MSLIQTYCREVISQHERNISKWLQVNKDELAVPILGILLIISEGELMTIAYPSLGTLGYQLLPLATSQLMDDNGSIVGYPWLLIVAHSNQLINGQKYEILCFNHILSCFMHCW